MNPDTPNLFKLYKQISIMRSTVESINKETAQTRFIVYKTKKAELVNYLKNRLKKDVQISEVRSRLSKIKESLAEDVVKHRE